MELNRLANQDLNLVPSFTYGDATGKVRHIRPEARWPTLEDNQVLQISASLLQAGLFENAVQRPARHFDARLPGDGHGAGLCWVTELSMAASLCRNLVPPVRLQASGPVRGLWEACLAEWYRRDATPARRVPDLGLHVLALRRRCVPRRQAVRPRLFLTSELIPQQSDA